MRLTNVYCACGLQEKFTDYIEAERSGRWRVLGWHVNTNKPILECPKCSEVRANRRPAPFQNGDQREGDDPPRSDDGGDNGKRKKDRSGPAPREDTIRDNGK